VIFGSDSHEDRPLIGVNILDGPEIDQILRQVVFQAEAWQVAKQTGDDEGELFPIIWKERRVWAKIVPRSDRDRVPLSVAGADFLARNRWAIPSAPTSDVVDMKQ